MITLNDTRLGRAARATLGMAVERSLVALAPRALRMLGMVGMATIGAPSATRWLGLALSIGLALLLAEVGL